MDKETLLPIKDFPNYKISDRGRVFSETNNKFLKPHLLIGYNSVTLHHGNVKKTVHVHRLVADAFLPNPLNAPMVNHKDGVKTNNEVTNLEWCTYKDNTVHAHANGLINTNKKGVVQVDDKGNIIREFATITEAGDHFKVSPSKIAAACRGKQIRCAGFKWRYQQEDDDGDIDTTGWDIISEEPEYMVSRDGRVYNMKKDKLVKITVSEDGYHCVKLNNHAYRVHRLVAMSYIPNNDPAKTVVNHKDGDKSNNRVDNLEWCTIQENTQHACDTGLNKSCKQVKRTNKITGEQKIYRNLIEAAKDNHCQYATITKACKGKIPKSSPHIIYTAYTWEYV